MTSQKAIAGTEVLDPLELALAQLTALATSMLCAHRDRHGICVACSAAWPCAPVLLADHNLSVR